MAIPVNSIVPTKSGTATVGATLTSSHGTWSNTPTSYTYVWQVSDNGTTGWTNISGATASTFVIAQAQANKYVRFGEVAVNADGAGTVAYSTATAQIKAIPVNTVLPGVKTGNAKPGRVVTGTNGTWVAYPTATYAHQWQYSADGVTSWTNISGATTTTYTVEANKVNKWLRYKSTATNSEGATIAYSVPVLVNNLNFATGLVLGIGQYTSLARVTNIGLPGRHNKLGR